MRKLQILFKHQIKYDLRCTLGRQRTNDKFLFVDVNFHRDVLHLLPILHLSQCNLHKEIVHFFTKYYMKINRPYNS
ncbi:hypothetical protein HanRHA438_Chr02g0092411 [Helianthus annuus]|nr:hypothetical protein HanRHA438_Chr02g0092411 [Helianthus annuus]